MEKANKKILIVDDDESFLFILKKEMSEEGFSVVTAREGKECLLLVEKEKPDLIISDVILPGMDGMEMAKKIKESDPSLPIVFLSNVSDQDYIEGIESLGNFEYLVKSNVQIRDIIAKVKSRLA